MSTELIIKQTERWLTLFVIKHSICPFAKAVFDQNSIHFAVTKNASIEKLLEALLTECYRLDHQPSLETTLIIYPENFKIFDDYLDFLEIAESLLVNRNYEGIYQIASFHPLYCFEGETIDDPANYTNRSPYPMIHLLRESSLEKAINSHPAAEKIPDRNIKLIREMGLQKIQNIFQQFNQVD